MIRLLTKVTLSTVCAVGLSGCETVYYTTETTPPAEYYYPQAQPLPPPPPRTVVYVQPQQQQAPTKVYVRNAPPRPMAYHPKPSKNYQAHVTPTAPPSKSYQANVTPPAPPSKNYQAHVTPSAPPSKSYQAHETPRAPTHGFSGYGTPNKGHSRGSKAPPEAPEGLPNDDFAPVTPTPAP